MSACLCCPTADSTWACGLVNILKLHTRVLQHLNLLHDRPHALKYLNTQTQRLSYEKFRIEFEPEWDTFLAQLEHRDGQKPNMNWEQIS